MTTTAAYRRHDISDRAWEALEPLLPGGPGKVGRPAQNNRRFINGVFWLGRTHFQVWGKPNHLGGGSGVAR